MLTESADPTQTHRLHLDHPNNLQLGETAFPYVVCSSRKGRLDIKAKDLPRGRSVLQASFTKIREVGYQRSSTVDCNLPDSARLATSEAVRPTDRTCDGVQDTGLQHEFESAVA
jgi:hypothetical protein